MENQSIHEKKIDLINKARGVLNGQGFSSKKLKALCKELEKLDQFGYASEVLLKKIAVDESNGEPFSLPDHHTLVKYIYKDHSLPSAFKYKKALNKLNSSDSLVNTESCETLGFAGAIYKRIWQYNHQFRHLILSRYYYKRGYDLWRKFIEDDQLSLKANLLATKSDQNDVGYTAINYAYINELMAIDKLEEHGLIRGVTPSINSLLTEAEEVRYFIIEKLLEFEKASSFDPNENKWIYPTIAEAYFGLRKYDTAAEYIEKYLDISRKYSGSGGRILEREKLENIAWEVRTFQQQLFSISYLQLFQKDYFLGNYKKTKKDEGKLYEISQEVNLEKINNCLNKFRALEVEHFIKEDHPFEEGPFMDEEDPVEEDLLNKEIKKDGKLGLALSGGGFRASLFHIGVLAALAEADKLKDIEVLSCVSGGSIIGAYYYLKLKQLLESESDSEIDKHEINPEACVDEKGKPCYRQMHYINIMRSIEAEFLEGVQKNMRIRLFTNPWKAIKMIFSKYYSRTHRIGELYEEFLYKKIVNRKHIYIDDLRIEPKSDSGTDSRFNIAIDNWKRSHKVPQLVLNATCLNTGHNWQFTASWMGEPPGAIQTDIDVKPRLRRMYYEDAPVEYRKFRLGYAVGASSCVPVLFTPLSLPDLYPGIDLQLVDGGLHDNQGIGALIEQECNNMIISDASGQMPTNVSATNGIGGVFYRADIILQERLRELQFKDIQERNETTQIRDLIKIHLKDGLQSQPINWKYCTDPPRKIMYDSDENSDAKLTKYGVLRSVQELLSEIRTDLDSFHDTEAYALMYSGYQQTNYKLGRDCPPAVRWKFLAMEKSMTQPDEAQKIIKKLKASKRLFFKAFDFTGFNKLKHIIFLLTTVVACLYFGYKFYVEPSTISMCTYLKIVVGIIGAPFMLFSVFSGLMSLYSYIITPIYNKSGEVNIKD